MNGKLQVSVGVIEKILIVIVDAQIYIPLQVINLTSKTLLLETDWLDKYKADVLSSIRKLRFIIKDKIIEVNMMNVRDQSVRSIREESNLYALWELRKEAFKIEFYYNKVVRVCLHLAEHPVETKQIAKQLSISVKRLLDHF